MFFCLSHFYIMHLYLAQITNLRFYDLGFDRSAVPLFLLFILIYCICSCKAIPAVASCGDGVLYYAGR